MKTKVCMMLWALGVCFLYQSHISAQNRHESAQEHLESFQDSELPTKLFKHLYFTDHYVSEHNGVQHYYFEQRLHNIPVYGKWWQIHLATDGKILKSDGDLMEHLSEESIAASYETIPSKSPEEALNYALEHLGIKQVEALELMSQAKDKWIFSGDQIAERPIEITLEWVPLDEKEIALSYNVNILPNRGANWWNIKINANTGVVIGEYDWTYHCTFHNYSEASEAFGISNNYYEEGNHGGETLTERKNKCSHTEEEFQLSKNHSYNALDLPSIGSASYKVYPLSVESPNHGFSSIIYNPWEVSGEAGTLGWHHDGSVEYSFLRGNNVYAKEDKLGNDGIGYSPSSSSLNFIYTPNFSQEPTLSENASLTNLFYWCNVNHDIWYQYGFNEASGNFQNDNLDRGGVENDYLFADGLDGEGMNNANFSVPPDGFKPRMQMYKWSGIQTEHLIIEGPSNIAGVYSASMANFGGVLPLSPTAFQGSISIVQDANNPQDSFACGGIANGAQLNGKIALVDRGGCLFNTKIAAAQDAGAVACIICNTDDNILEMSGNGTTYTIPVVLVSSSTCDKIKSVGSGLSVKLNRVPNVNRDASFDNGLISHEYAHGISGRLTGGPMNPNCFYNEEQMSEGISDWMSLILLMSENDNGADPRGLGTYISSQPNEAKGLRIGYYSTDMEVNPTTYSNLCDDNISVPHGVGYVWGSVLWDLSWALIEEYGFDSDVYYGSGGNNIAMQLVIDGLKLQNCNPGFTDARDALLLADQINNGGANSCLMWEVFARRGLGYSAAQGSTFDRCDGIAAFDMPPNCLENTDQQRVKGRVLLEGYMNASSGLMTNHQNHLNLLENNHPFSGVPWYYNGNESLPSSLPINLVSWVLVELRNNNNPEQILSRKAALLRNDGVLIDVDKQEGVDFSTKGLTENSFYVVIYQKNHLGIMSSGVYSLNSTDLYDFTSGENKAMGISQLKLAGSKYTMLAGDFDHNGVINNLDYNLWAQQNALINETVGWDADGNGVINNLDFNLWYRNRSMLSISLLYDN